MYIVQGPGSNRVGSMFGWVERGVCVCFYRSNRPHPVWDIPDDDSLTFLYVNTRYIKSNTWVYKLLYSHIEHIEWVKINTYRTKLHKISPRQVENGYLHENIWVQHTAFYVFWKYIKANTHRINIHTYYLEASWKWVHKDTYNTEHFMNFENT